MQLGKFHLLQKDMAIAAQSSSVGTGMNSESKQLIIALHTSITMFETVASPSR